MCDVTTAIAHEKRLDAIERMLGELLLEHDPLDPHPHAHEGYVTHAHLRSAVDTCLAEAADEAEREHPAPAPKKKEEPRPAPAPEPREPAKREPGPAAQGAPERRHALHRRVGGRAA